MARDLATVDEPITDLFPHITPEEIERHSLSPEQVAFFHEHGYLANVRILNGPQVDALRADLEHFFDASHDGRELWYEYHSNESGDTDSVLFHALGAWRISPAFHDTLWNPAFVVPASQLFGGRAVRFWHDQLFCKPAKHGGVVAWHQDYSYWTRTVPMAHLTCWIGLDDATVDNGCLNYVPGSHRWELLPITGLAYDMNAIESVLTADQQAAFDKRVAIELEAGCAAFHHPLMVHGSYENRSERSRRALVLNAFADGTQSASGDVLLEGVPPIPAGQPMGGTFFPLLYDPADASVTMSADEC